MRDSTRVGTVVAGYRIESVLGRGGMSVVYLAEHLRLARKAALKVLAPALAEDEAFRERFIHESQRAADLEHPNVIPIYDAGEVPDGEAAGLLYIAMRYVEGSDLKALIEREGPPAVGRTLFLLDQVAAALDAAHGRDLVHRDVKPANILVEPTDHVFLTDFGVAKQTTAPGLTKTGIFVGTIDYAAPEQIEGRPLDGRTDVYALGCVLYECLAGRRPFERENELAAMQAHLTAPAPVVTEARPDLPNVLDHVVGKAMAKDREDRFATCSQLLDAARGAVLGRGSPPPARVDTPPVQPAPTAPEPPRPQRYPRWAVPAAFALAVITIVALAALVLTRDDSGDGAGPGTGQVRSDLAIDDLVPPSLAKECEAGAARLGADATRICRPPNPSSGFVPERWEISAFQTRDALRRAYEEERLRRGINRSTGRCSKSEWNGEDSWVHRRGESGGRLLCFLDEQSRAILIWTHEASGEEEHAKLLGIARRLDSANAALFQWWQFWRDRIGHPQS